MTPKEALEIRNNPTFKDVDNEELSKCIDEALKIQIPKKPIEDTANLTDFKTFSLSYLQQENRIKIRR